MDIICDCYYNKDYDIICRGEYAAYDVSGSIMRRLVDNASPECGAIADNVMVKQLCDNHKATRLDIENMASWVQQVKDIFYKNKNPAQDEDAVSEAQKRLGISFPDEIKALYLLLHQCPELLEGADGARYLPLSELYIDNDHIVFFKVKRSPIALSLEDGHVKFYRKKQWVYEKGAQGFCKMALIQITENAILHMPHQVKGELRGAPAAKLNAKETIAAAFQEILKPYKMRDPTFSILYNTDGSLALLSSNGFTADILFGSKDNSTAQKILDSDLGFNFDKNY